MFLNRKILAARNLLKTTIQLSILRPIEKKNLLTLDLYQQKLSWVWAGFVD